MGSAVISSIAYDNSYARSLHIPMSNARNIRITPQRYSRLQQKITSALNPNDNESINANTNLINSLNLNHTSTVNEDKLISLRNDIDFVIEQKANAEYEYPSANKLFHPHIDDDEHKKQSAAKQKSNSVNYNNLSNPSKEFIQGMLKLPTFSIDTKREATPILIASDNEEKEAPQPLRRSKRHKTSKITPMKRKLTELV